MRGITYIINGSVVTPTGIISPGYVGLSNGCIAEVGPMDALCASSDSETIDVLGCLVLPGLIDIHTHGSGGLEVLTADWQDMAKLARNMLRFGVTSFLPTLTATRLQTMYQTTKAARIAQGKSHGGANILGVYFEGPYMNPEYRGAQPLEHVRNPVPGEYLPLLDECEDMLRIMLVAPELPGALKLIEECTSRGIIAALGHCKPTYELAKQAVASGADHAVHAFNACPDFKKRDPGLAGAFLNSEQMYIEIIADGNHLHPAAIEIAYKLKGPDKMILISDSVPLAGLPDGVYECWDQHIEIRGSRANLADSPGVLAGSVAGLNQCLGVAVSDVGIPLENAVQMASTTPAKRLGLQSKGRIEPGLDADIAVLNRDYSARMTLVGGKVGFRQDD
ncbi:MAG: N-acetylglucosamine-6-phosphate deacetylase [Limnochordia bacterium]|nr:N-acetylglucosamine-6-phosphate deacetylase [Limnochordia bacterium]MDD2628851.1 N-acetylglucosamine-6-phosphate deacetylase [Limnochordia bacterium]MDD4518786.1 N-acetylglucosamine-6-phosphate deacetylase [Limnochordia bacterium]